MPPEIPEALQQAASSVKRKKKPVRRDMEKRRQQNVQAQKKYRECLSSVLNVPILRIRE